MAKKKQQHLLRDNGLGAPWGIRYNGGNAEAVVGHLLQQLLQQRRGTWDNMSRQGNYKHMAKWYTWVYGETGHVVIGKQGVNPKIVQGRLGHSSIGITMDIYSHVMPNMQRDAIANFNIALDPVK